MEEVGIVEVEDHKVRAKFRVTFQNAVSRLRIERKLVSKTFIFSDFPWNIDLECNPDAIAISLNCLETKPGFSFKGSFKVSVIRVSGPPFEGQEMTTTFNNANVRSAFGPNILKLGILSYHTQAFIFDHALTLHVDMKTDFIPIPKRPEEKEELALPLRLQPSATKGLVEDLVALLESGDGDVAFKLKDGAVIKAHKSILCARNAVFDTMLSVDMKEAKAQEVGIEDMGLRALKILLLYIYTGQLSLFEGVDVEGCKEVVNAAEKYNLPELKEVAGMALAEFRTATNAFQLFTFCRDRNVKEATKVLAVFVKENVDEVLGLGSSNT